MRDSQGSNRSLPVGWLIAGLLLAIVGYNYWSYRCGYCTISSLLSLSVPAVLLISLNLVACVVLLSAKIRNRRWLERQRCSCGANLHTSWVFCPCCGSSRKNLSA